MNKTLPIMDLGNKWVEYFKSIDCKYLVINLQDMARAISNEEMNELNNFIQKYNDYRVVTKGKDVSSYFCAKRDDFPVFKDNALGFWEWVHSAYNKEYGRTE